MSPLSKLLIRRINRSMMILLVVMMTRHRHSGTMSLEALHRDALVNHIVAFVFVVGIVGDFDFARELDVVILVMVSIACIFTFIMYDYY
jgi:hypothetical protein